MKDILISVNPSDTQVSIVSDGELVEFWVERKNMTRLVGNIYKGRVQNVLNGMQAAKYSKTSRIKNSISRLATIFCVKSLKSNLVPRAQG